MNCPEASRLSPDALRAAAAGHGLCVRGIFAAEEVDAVPPLADGRAARSVVLFGNAGSSYWPAFSGSSEYRDGEPDPLDRWTRRVAEAMARRFAAMALYPFGGPPHYPFLRWARKAEGLHPSPVGMLIHGEYGLWHAYRFALAFAQPLRDEPVSRADAAPCDSCAARPCLSACPAGAFTGSEYRVERCVAYLQSTPDAPCRRGGCLVRHACPTGQAYRYHPAQAAFHMRAFVARHGGETSNSV